MAVPTIRPLTPDDFGSVDRILAASGEGVADASGQWPYLELIEACGRALVAELDDRIVGFAATVPSGRITHVSDLFVDPGHQGTGIGSRLLAEVLGDAWPRTTFSSADPRALPLYVRNGLRPGWPGCYVVGSAEALPQPAAGLTTEPLVASAMTEVERRIAGVDRAVLHAHEAREAGSLHLAVRAGDRIVAAGHARDARKDPGRWLDRLVVDPAADPVEAVVAALAAAAVPGRQVGTCVPGPHPALAVLLEAGFRIIDRDVYCESEPGLVDPARSLPDPALL